MTLSEQLTQLKLTYLANNLDSFITGQKKASAREVITRMADLELIEKSSRTTERRLKAAKLGTFKKMSDFEWDWPKEVNRRLIEELMGCDFIGSSKNIILAGAQGIGKSMIARNLAWNAVLKGETALFTTASRMILDLGAQESNAALQRCLAKYEKPKLLVVDEVGYLSYDTKSADYIFEIVNRRYEKGSIVMTTNLAFKDWHKVFPGAPCVTAMIDRLTHHADIIKISGSSFRSKEAAEYKTKSQSDSPKGKASI